MPQPLVASSALQHGAYDPWLVALSVLVASIAAFVALTMAERVATNTGGARRAWLAGGAVALGCGIWSMHFTGMLAFHLKIPISYDIITVVVSLLAGVGASGVALAIVSLPELPLGRWLAGGSLMGIGIAAMHYTGMAAMRMQAMIQWNVVIIIASVLIAVLVSLVAIWLVFHLRSPGDGSLDWRRPVAAVIMGLAIAGMHYTGMAAAGFTPMSMPVPTQDVIGADQLGGESIALITVLALGLALGVAYVDRRFSASNQALAESRNHIRTVVANAPVFLFALDSSGTITLAEGRGVTSDFLVGRSVFEAFADASAMLEDARQALAGNELTTVRILRDRVYETRWTPLAAGENAPSGVIAVVTDVSDRHRAEAALEHQAFHDALTDLPNRALLKETLEQALLTAERERAALTLAVMDLNRFKEINDTLGHGCGDELLRQVAGRVRRALRASDFVARLGGDEFAILLPGADNASALQVIQRTLEELATPFELEGHSLDAGGSIGIAVYPTHGTDADTLMRHADVAMYVAKRAGTGYAVYNAAHDQHSSARLTLMGDLRQAISDGQLEVHYQPKIELTGGKLSKVEALVRWRHPTLGQLPPDRFIPLAEQSGLISPLTRWVLDASLGQAAAWERSGIHLGVAVNVSMRVLHDPTLPETIAWLLRRHGVAPSQLTVEITESALMADPTTARAALDQLREIGIRVAIDDFGTGYSSLAYIKHLPVDEIKIDKSFILGMDTDHRDSAIVRSVSDLGHNLGLHVVAEGVETVESLDALRALGCDTVQGYFVSRPLPAADLETWLRDAPWAVERNPLRATV